MRSLLMAAAAFIILAGLLFLYGAFGDAPPEAGEAVEQALEPAQTVDENGTSFEVETGSMAVSRDAEGGDSDEIAAVENSSASSSEAETQSEPTAP